MRRKLSCTLLMASMLLPALLVSQDEQLEPARLMDQVTTLLEAGDDAGAVELLEKAVQQQDTPTTAVALLGALYFEAGRSAEALTILRDIADVDPPDPAVLYNAGRAARAVGEQELAERYLNQSLTLLPGTPAARELGLLFGGQGRYTEALVLLTDWTRSQPDDIESRLAAAHCAIELERPQDAETMLSDLPQTLPRVRLLWGQLLVLQGDPWGALATLKPALEEAPPELELELRRLTAEANSLVGQAEEAVELLEDYGAASADVALQLAQAQYQSGDSSGALTTLNPWAELLLPEPSAESHPGLVGGLALLYGRLLVREGRAEEALPYLELASRAQPLNKEIWQALGQSFASLGRQAEATEALERFQELSAEEAALEKGTLERSEELADPTGKVIANAMQLVAEGQVEEALRLMQMERALAPNDLRIWLLEGRFLLELGRQEEALQIVQQILEVAPDNADALYLSGLTRMQAGDRQEAEADLRLALELDPNHIAAMNDLAVLLMARSETAEAQQLLERVLEINPDDPLAAANLESLKRP